jgi:hypothetical protein
VVIHHEGGTAGELPVAVEVSPVIVTNALLKIQARPTTAGDVNLDYELNLTDAIAILRDLFSGTGEVLCANAADFNGDGKTNITDPVGILNFLFAGGQGPARDDVICGGP